MIFACGAVLTLAMLALAFVDPRSHPALFVGLAAVSGAAYLITLPLLGRARGRGLVLCLALAALWRIPLLVQPPQLSTDIYRYVWDGRLQRFGENPYRVVPDDPRVVRLHTPVTRQLNNGWVPTVYPPGAEIFFRAVTAVDESAGAVKAAIVLCDVLVIFALLRLLAATRYSPWCVLAYAWNPLVALEGAGNGHIDLAGTLALVLTAWALARERRTIAALVFALAVGIKFLPCVLAPLLWRRIRMRDAVAGAGLLATLYLPFVHAGHVPFGSLTTYLAQWRFNGPLFAALNAFFPSSVLVALAVVVGLIIAVWVRARLGPQSPAAWAWPLAATLAVAPVVYPWYLLWLTPFLFTRATLPLAVWTVTILTTYIVIYLSTVHGGLQVPWWVVAAEYGAVIGAGAVVLGRGAAGAPDVVAETSRL